MTYYLLDTENQANNAQNWLHNQLKQLDPVYNSLSQRGLITRWDIPLQVPSSAPANFRNKWIVFVADEETLRNPIRKQLKDRIFNHPQFDENRLFIGVTKNQYNNIMDRE